MLTGYKTYVVGVLTVLGAIGGYLTGNLAPEQAINLVLPAVLAMTIRNGIATTSKAT